MEAEGQLHHVPLDGKHIFIFALIGVALVAFVMSRGAANSANSQSTTPDYVNTTPIYYGDPANGTLPGGTVTNNPTPPPAPPSTPVKPTPPPTIPVPEPTIPKPIGTPTSPAKNGTPVRPGVNPTTHQIDMSAAQRNQIVKQLNNSGGKIRSGPVNIKFQNQAGQASTWQSNSTHSGSYTASQVGYVDPNSYKTKPPGATTYVAGLGWF